MFQSPRRPVVVLSQGGLVLLMLGMLAGCNRFFPDKQKVGSAPSKATELVADPLDGSGHKNAAPGRLPGESPPPDGNGFGSEGGGEPRLASADAAPDWLPGEGPAPAGEQFPFDALEKPLDPPPEAKGLIRLPNPEKKGEFVDVWADPVNKRLVLAGIIVKRRGTMELFACLARTKEHESIVSIRTKAFAAHGAMLAMGVRPGWPVQFFPSYRQAIGPEIQVTVHWTDKAGKRHSASAQSWLRNKATGKELQHPWVLGGSDFWVSEDGKEQYFLAEDGNFICVSNFPDALMDLPIKSSQSDSALLFEAFTERIPPVGTAVAITLTPKPWTREPFIAPPPRRRRPRGPESPPSRVPGAKKAGEAEAEKAR